MHKIVYVGVSSAPPAWALLAHSAYAMQDLNGRKRKETSSAAAAPASAAKRAAVAREVPHEEPIWEDFVAGGDSAVLCLSHKLSLKKRDTVTTVRDFTLAYIKRLRALGWHLHSMCERYGCTCKTVKAHAVSSSCWLKRCMCGMFVLLAQAAIRQHSAGINCEG